jgi:glutamate synthase domain-containing protein 3
VATQDEELSKRFAGKPEYIINYFNFVAQELREIMAGIGIRNLDELIGRSDLLETDKAMIPWKAKEIDYSRILYKPVAPKNVDVRCTVRQAHGIDKVLDKKLIETARPALKEGKAVKGEIFINNTNRTTGAMLSGEICRIYGEEGLPDDTICFKFSGVAGQSFGAWLAKGVTFELEGMANDYIGKGISGGKIIVYPPKESTFASEKNIIVGNTTFYGAISGEAYISGVAGERFCIRNSGLNAVVEGVGDHGCEYMTGGHVVVLGDTGRNFGAGMSGGIAYVYDRYNDFAEKCNMNMVGLEKVSKEDKKVISDLINNHYKYTKSPVAKKILDNFENETRKFIKVMPTEYKRVLEEKELAEESDLAEVSDG